MGRLAALQADVQAMLDEQQSRYGYGAASEASLNRHFDEKGVQWARRYVKSWAGWHFVDWEKAKSGFFGNHAHKLLVSGTPISAAGGAPAADLDYLTSGVEELRRVAEELDALMQQKMATDADRALILDRIQALNEQRANASKEARARIDGQIAVLREEEKQIAVSAEGLDQTFHTVRRQELFSSLKEQSATRIRIDSTTRVTDGSGSRNGEESPESDCVKEAVFVARSDVKDLVARFDTAMQQELTFCPESDSSGS